MAGAEYHGNCPSNRSVTLSANLRKFTVSDTPLPTTTTQTSPLRAQRPPTLPIKLGTMNPSTTTRTARKYTLLGALAPSLETPLRQRESESWLHRTLYSYRISSPISEGQREPAPCWTLCFDRMLTTCYRSHQPLAPSKTRAGEPAAAADAGPPPR
jgi:hypothetical protein